MNTPNTDIAHIVAGAIDIGNTRIKMLAGNQFFAADLSSPWQDAMHQYLWNFSGKDVIFGVSSVNPAAMETLEHELKKRSNIRWKILADVYSKQRLVDISGIQGIGSDRVLSLVGALHHTVQYFPAQIAPILTIDCGTAITINAMNTRRKCLGGAILPGIGTQLRALHHFTQQLPVVEPGFEDVSAGTNTAQAIRIGVVRGAAGAIKEIAGTIIERDFSQELPFILITGGDAALMMEALESWQYTPMHAPHLVLHGVSMLMSQWMQDSFTPEGQLRLNA